MTHPTPETERRADPDALVARLQAQARQAGRGKLRIYFGSNAGVGKTCAMLAAARRERDGGRSVLVGLVETHGRAETEAQLADLPLLARQALVQPGRTLLEFDLDAALAQHPDVLLLDELAHSNAPGARHPKRWQDVDELLAAGIEVWTTLNVQHLESLNDVVSGIVGVAVRETVPDRVFDEADEVVVVDTSPDELLARLKAGRIYPLAQAERAARNFFRRGNLLALRELALRRTADRVDEAMRDYRREQAIDAVWPARERLLVAVRGQAGDDALVRQVARLARRLEAPWIVVYVDAPGRQHRSRRAREALLKTLALAARLGADTATIPGTHVARALVGFARERNASHLVLARMPHRLGGWRLWSALRPGLPEQVAQLAPGLDVLVLSTHVPAPPGAAPVSPPAKTGKRLRVWPYVGASLACLAASGLANLLLQVFDLANVVMLFLLVVMLSALRWGRGPGAWAALLAVLCLDFFFVAPRNSFSVNDTQYLFTFALMLVVALVCGQLMARLRHEARVATERERRAGALARLARDLSGALTQAQVSDIALRTLAGVFDARTGLLLPDAAEQLQTVAGSAADMDPSVARWCMDHGQPAGRGTDTLAAAQALYVPLCAPVRVRGVLALQLNVPGRLDVPEERRLLDACASQIALALERVHFVDVAKATQVEMAGERMRNTLLAAVSHDVRTPLTSILGAAQAALPHASPGPVADMLGQIREQAQAMQQLVDNILTLARLQQGGVHLQRSWVPVDELVGSALAQLRERLAQHPVRTDLPADLPLLHVDALLMERVLVNLLDNAAKHTPAGTAIDIGARVQGEWLQLRVQDAGPGLPPQLTPEQLLAPFTRGKRESAVAGMGLGLALVQRIVQAHDGRLRVSDGPGGTCFEVALPVSTPPDLAT